MKQAYNTAIRATEDAAVIRNILNVTADYIKQVNLEETPADLSNFVYKTTAEITGIADPYEREKKQYNDLCLSMVPALRKTIDASDDPLYSAIKVALFGNLIDLGIGHKIDIQEKVKNLFEESLAIDDYPELKRMLASDGKKILYLGDNAGEIVFDRLFVEKLVDPHAVTYVVKRGPIINDATMDDARATGMTELTTVIDTGSDTIGVKWDEVSEEFLDHYNSADIVIAKGQGNFETNSDRPGTIFFLLRAKCDCVARVLGVNYGDIVIKRGPITEETG